MVGMGGWIYSVILVWRVKTVLRVIIGPSNYASSHSRFGIAKRERKSGSLERKCKKGGRGEVVRAIQRPTNQVGGGGLGGRCSSPEC